jgi:prepilin-type processing-associated H-X9-DG protein
VVELLVVIAIIGVLVALLMPAVQMAREAARRTECQSNMRQCAMAITGYATSKGHLPPSRSVVSVGSPAANVALNWVYPVLSELEQVSIHNQIRTGTLPEPTTIKILKCPSQPRYGDVNYPLSYVVNGGRANDNTAPHVNFDWIENGVFVDKGAPNTNSSDKHRIEEIAKYDGTSNTLMMSENPNVAEWLRAPKEQYSQMLWFPEGYQKDPAYNPAFDAAPPALAFGLNRSVRDVNAALFDSEIRYARPGSYHPGGFNVALCDGSIHWMAENTDYGVYAVLMTSRDDRANNPANTTFPGTNPIWASRTTATAAQPYPGTKFE